jgi:hypothetical protein
MMRDEFQRWLIDRRYAPNTAYQYSVAINRLSGHYSQKMGRNIDIYTIRDINALTELVNKYRYGIYRDKGDEGHATNINALERYKEYIEHLYHHPEPPREKPRHRYEDPGAARDKVIGELQANLSARDQIISDLRIKGKRVVVDRDHLEAKAKRYEVEIATLKAGAARFQRVKVVIAKCLHPNAYPNANKIEVQVREKVFTELWPEIEKIEGRNRGRF